MTITQLKVLSTVVDLGSFTKAAEALHMTQSAVSHAIASLEADLGVVLLIRDRHRGLALSDFGRRVLEPARRILNGVSHIEQEALSVRGLESGTLRLGSFPSAAVRMLPRIMSAFGRLHPNIEIVLFEGSDQEVLDWLDSRAIDVGVVAQSAVGPGMTLLAKDRMVAVLPPDHAQRYGPVVTVATLAGQPFIMSSGGCEPLIQELFAHAGCAPAVRFAVRDTETILNMVREGLGITMMPEMALPDRLPDVVVKALEPDAWRYLGLRSSSDEATPSARAFVALAQSLFSPAEGDTTSGVKRPSAQRLSQKID